MAIAIRATGLAVSDPEIIARTGWTAEDLSAAIDTARPTGPFGLVSLLIGVNNQFRGRLVEEFGKLFVGALDRAIRCAGGTASRVLVLSIPDWGVTPYAAGRDRYRIATEIDAFNAVTRREALGVGARYVDITPLSREAAADRSLLAGDGLHPAAAMYAGWVRLAMPQAMRALTEPR